MKILILTKNHPVEILDTVTNLMSIFPPSSGTLCVSPQCVALMIEEAKGIPYTAGFYPAIHQVELQKEEMASKYENFIVVGTTDSSTKNWYDVIVGLDNPDIADYKVLNEDFNTNHYKCFSLKDADIKFDSFQQLIIFLKRLLGMVQKNNEVQ